MGGYGNVFLDTYHTALDRYRQEAQERRAREAQKFNMAREIEEMESRRQQRRLQNLDTALKLETDRAQAGLEELPGPVRPGEGAVGFKNPERELMDYGELPQGFDPSEITRIANARAQRSEAERMRAQATAEFERGLKREQEDRKARGEEALIRLRNATTYQKEHPAPPKDRSELSDNDLREYYRAAAAQFADVEHTDEDIEAEVDRRIAADDARLKRRKGGGGDMLAELNRLNAMTLEGLPGAPPPRPTPTPSKPSAPKKPDVVTSEAQYNALPPGASYIDGRDGRLKTKKR